MRIIYKNPDDSISIIIPSPEYIKNHTIKDVAKKDVLFGLPYWIVEDFEIPTDREFRNAWTWDTDKSPDGVGGEL